MARTKAQLLIRRLKRTPWKPGQRLQLGEYSIALLPTGQWYVSKNHTPVRRGRYQGIEGGRNNAMRSLRSLIRADHATA
jgi:hypothetical protein